MEGQLLEYERAFLFWTLIAVKPMNVIEIGTWKGGGSTYQIASALKMNGSGHLYTCELNKEFYDQAIASYRNNPLRIHINFYNMASSDFLKEICESVIPNFVFFDGAEDAQLNLDDFKYLDQFLHPGAMFMSHDWDLDERIDGGVSQKNQLLRPYLESNNSWKIIKVITKPNSVGMVLAEKVVI